VSLLVWPGTQALIQGGAPSRSFDAESDVGCVSDRPGPPKQVQPLPPEASFSRRASVAFWPDASNRITWCTIVERCGLITALVT
jgi:hypothetical protein